MECIPMFYTLLENQASGQPQGKADQQIEHRARLRTGNLSSTAGRRIIINRILRRAAAATTHVRRTVCAHELVFRGEPD